MFEMAAFTKQQQSCLRRGPATTLLLLAGSSRQERALSAARVAALGHLGHVPSGWPGSTPASTIVRCASTPFRHDDVAAALLDEQQPVGLPAGARVHAKSAAGQRGAHCCLAHAAAMLAACAGLQPGPAVTS